MIAQIIAGKTGRTTYAYVNYTSQKKIGSGYYQRPTDDAGETLKTYTYINKKGKEERKKRKGRIIKKFTKFTPNK